MRSMRNMVVVIACLTMMTGCGWKWWAAKQVISKTAEDAAEATNLSKTKEELHAEIKELKKELNTQKEEKTKLELRVKELEVTCGKPGGLTEGIVK